MEPGTPIKSEGYAAVKYFGGRYKLLFSGILGLTLLNSVLESFGVLAFFPVFTTLLGQSSDSTAGTLGFVNRFVDAIPVSNPLIGASTFLISVFFLKTTVALSREYLTSYAVAKVHSNLKQEIMDRYASAHYQYILDTQQGALHFNLLEAPGAVAGLLMVIAQMATALFKIAAITIVLIVVIPIATVVLISVSLAYYFLTHLLSKKISYRLGVEKARVATTQNVIVNEFLSGFRPIVTLNAEKSWTARFGHEVESMRRLEIREALWQATPRPLMELMMIGLMMGVILVVWLTSSGGVTGNLPKVGLFAVALAQIMPPLAAIGASRMKVMAGLPMIQLAHQTLTGPMPQRTEGHRNLDYFEKSIDFDNVSFGHPNRDRLFDGLNLSFKKGDITAIVGTSGAGKTTLVNLILGLLEPLDGRVTVDGVPIQEYRQASWLNKIGFVSQEPFTYHSTVTANITLGRDTFDEKSILEASKTANAHEFVTSLPHKYDTIVGERGMRLSGGQQQRLAIARALLGSPEILIFDEATSNLDNISEQLVQKAIQELSVDRTTIIIAHRLSTIQNADKIIVLEQGKVVETGQHQELLDQKGHYARLAGVK